MASPDSTKARPLSARQAAEAMLAKLRPFVDAIRWTEPGTSVVFPKVFHVTDRLPDAKKGKRLTPRRAAIIAERARAHDDGTRPTNLRPPEPILFWRDDIERKSKELGLDYRALRLAADKCARIKEGGKSYDCMRRAVRDLLHALPATGESSATPIPPPGEPTDPRACEALDGMIVTTFQAIRETLPSLDADVSTGGTGGGNRSTTRRGREKADYETCKLEATIAREWKRAREKKICKADWVVDNSNKSGYPSSLKELDRLLDRVAARNRDSE